MWLLDASTRSLKFVSDSKDYSHAYAILSHTWEDEECTFQELLAGTGTHKKGWVKVVEACEQALRDGWEYVWIDTVCINKESSAELSEAINSMWQWYCDAQVCYAYLSDVAAECPELKEADVGGALVEDDNDCLGSGDSVSLSQDPVEILSAQATRSIPWNLNQAYAEKFAKLTGTLPGPQPNESFSEARKARRRPWSTLWGVKSGEESDSESWQNQRWHLNFARSRWLKRGWTLQELIAPQRVVFYGHGWNRVAEKNKISYALGKITGIDPLALEDRASLSNFVIARKMSWAKGRRTTRIEDRAYSLLGIMGVNMPLLYGEGERAFARLQE